jgi:SAM-dependent methyltransferase
MTKPDLDIARREMLETNQAQRAYYDQTDGGAISEVNGWGTNLWRAMRQRALKSVSGAQRARVYDVHRRWLGDLSEMKVLDLGAGHGSPLSQYLAENAGVYHALDLAPAQIAQLQDRIGAAPNRVFSVGDFLSDDYAEADFDMIYAHSVFHHFRHMDVMLDRVAQKLAPGGRVISYDPLEIWVPIRLIRRAYRPFQTDRDWEYPFDAPAVAQIAGRFQVIDRLGVFGRGKWALVLGILSPRLATRWGDKLFASDFDRPQTDRDIRASLHVSFLLKAK